MQLVSMNRCKKYYGDRLILDIDHFEIIEQQRIGLVGVNGAGKTTLIKLLLNEIELDQGNIDVTDSVAYISQKGDPVEQCTDGKLNGLFHLPDQFGDYLSEGEKVKVKLANALKENKKLIIADEPTANLDQGSIGQLEKMLQEYQGALLLVSHDREFLDSLCDTIVQLEDGKLSIYPGNYSQYVQLKEQERQRQLVEYEQYRTEKRRLEQAMVEKQQKCDRIRQTPKRMGNSEARLHKMGGQQQKQKLDRNTKGIQSRINHLEVKEKPKELDQIKIDILPGLAVSSKNLVEVKELTLQVGQRILIEECSFTIKKGRKYALLGKNGCGKSTLLKAIINNDHPAIRINPKVNIGYFDQTGQQLDEQKSILVNIKECSSLTETFIRINLSRFGFSDDEVYKPVGVLSGGERVKVALCKTLLEDNNFLILDEPTNFLDVVAIEALEQALCHTTKTVLMVSHDRAFVSAVCDSILQIENQRIQLLDGTQSSKELGETPRDAKYGHQQEERLILDNQLSRVISLLAVETDEEKKGQYEAQYQELLQQRKKLLS